MPRSRDKAQRDYVRGWESASRKPYPYKDVPPANSRKHSGPALRLHKLWERDRLGVLGVCCAILAVALIVLPADVRWERERTWIPVFDSTVSMLTHESGYKTRWITTERLPAAGLFAFAALTILLLRRR